MTGARWHVWTDCLGRVRRWHGIAKAGAVKALPPCASFVAGVLPLLLVPHRAPPPRPVPAWPSAGAPGTLGPLGGVPGGYAPDVALGGRTWGGPWTELGEVLALPVSYGGEVVGGADVLPGPVETAASVPADVPADVPEPSTAGVVLAGIVGALVLRRGLR